MLLISGDEGCNSLIYTRYTQLKKSDSYLRYYRFLSVLMRIGFKSLPKILV